MNVADAQSAFVSLAPPALRGGRSGGGSEMDTKIRDDAKPDPFVRQDTYTPDGQRLPPDGEQPEPASEDAADARGQDGEPLTDAEREQVEKLKVRDREVRAHEMAHKAAAGPYATSGPTYSYQTGPDGRRYAVGGSVGIDLSPEDTPEATIEKMAVVRRAALAPAEPSSQDQRVAAQASQIAMEARQEKLQQERETNSESSDTEAIPGPAGEPRNRERKSLDVYA